MNTAKRQQQLELRSKLLFWKDPTFATSRLSVIALICAGVLPLVGVLVFGWRVFDVVYIYWLENVIIGIFNVMKMIVAQGETPDAENKGQDAGPQVANHATKLFVVPFFSVHYGMFCFVHGVFVVTLLADRGMEAGFVPFAPLAEMLRQPWFMVALLGVVVSHGISFVSNYIGKREYREYSAISLMFQPYGRIIVLHVAIIFGAFLIMSLGSPLLLLVIVVVGKVWLDIALHLFQHRDANGS